jgi:hypothetical protein
MTATDEIRQTFQASQHLAREHGWQDPTVWPATEDNDIAVVEVMPGLRLQSDDPEVLRLLARSFDKAAFSIERLRGMTETLATTVSFTRPCACTAGRVCDEHVQGGDAA